MFGTDETVGTKTAAGMQENSIHRIESGGIPLADWLCSLNVCVYPNSCVHIGRWAMNLNTRSAKGNHPCRSSVPFSKCSRPLVVWSKLPILIQDCCALQISISSALIRCCIQRSLTFWAGRICVTDISGVPSVTRELCMLSGRYVVLHYCAVPAVKLLNRGANK